MQPTQSEISEFNQVVSVVAERQGLTVNELFILRSQRGVRSRRTAYLVMRQLGWSLHEIGEAFGKHHTTVMYSLKNVHALEEQFAKRVVRLIYDDVRQGGLDG